MSLPSILSDPYPSSNTITLRSSSKSMSHLFRGLPTLLPPGLPTQNFFTLFPFSIFSKQSSHLNRISLTTLNTSGCPYNFSNSLLNISSYQKVGPNSSIFPKPLVLSYFPLLLSRFLLNTSYYGCTRHWKANIRWIFSLKRIPLTLKRKDRILRHNHQDRSKEEILKSF